MPLRPLPTRRILPEPAPQPVSKAERWLWPAPDARRRCWRGRPAGADAVPSWHEDRRWIPPWRGYCFGCLPRAVGPVNGAGERGGRHRTRVENLRSTTIPAQVARPVELCMKSMPNTTGLGSGGGVDALCRFPVTLPAQNRGSGRSRRSTTGPGDPQQALTHPPSLLPFTEPIAGQSRGRHHPVVGLAVPPKTPAVRLLRTAGDVQSLARVKY